jgi:hypothetical protein
MTSARATAGIALLAAVAAACDEATPVVRGFDSRQLLAMRDPTLRFNNGAYLSFRNHVTFVTGEGEDKRHWSVDLDTAELREHDEWFTDLIETPAVAPGRFTCTWGAGVSGESALLITDTQTGQQVSITGLYTFVPRCPTEADTTLTVWRNTGGRLALWTGPFDALARAPLDHDLVVSQVLTFRDGATHVIAATVDQPEALGLHRIDLASFAVTTIVPATLAGGAWVSGVAAMGDLESSSLVVPLGYASGDFYPSPLGERFVYHRKMSDGGMITFVGPYADGPARELALARKGTSTVVRGTTPRQLAWIEWDVTGVTRTLHLYDDDRRLVLTCDRPSSSLLVATPSADGREVLFSPEPHNPATDVYQAIGPVLLMTPARAAADGTGACTVIAASDALAAGRSPDDATLFWLVQVPDSWDTELWTAARDGSAPRLLATDRIGGPPAAPRFADNNQLELKLDRDLVWIDVRDDPVRTHHVVENVFGASIGIGRWLVTGHDYSDQDASGRLGVVNLDTGETLPMSPQVQGFASPDHSATRMLPADRVVRVVYVVRGRNPSPQDGLWLATIDGAALPSR